MLEFVLSALLLIEYKVLSVNKHDQLINVGSKFGVITGFQTDINP